MYGLGKVEQVIEEIKIYIFCILELCKVLWNEAGKNFKPDRTEKAKNF